MACSPSATSKARQLAAGDDRPGSSDPLVDFTVPAGVNKLQIAFKDLHGRGGSDYVYRVAVLDLSKPDFSLSLATDRIIVPAGGTQVVPVQVTRTNYNGPIELSLDGLPAEIQLQGNIVPAGATIGLLTLSAQNVSPQAVLSRLVGRALEAQPPVLRAATFGEFPGSRHQPRVQTELGLAISTASPIGIAWVPQETDKLFLGGKLPAKVQLTRAEGTTGSVRIRLLTTQPMPKKTIKENNQDKVVDDVDRTLRLEGDPVFAADQKEVTVNVLVPGDLPQQPWDLVLVADLLDGRRQERGHVDRRSGPHAGPRRSLHAAAHRRRRRRRQSRRGRHRQAHRHDQSLPRLAARRSSSRSTACPKAIPLRKCSSPATKRVRAAADLRLRQQARRTERGKLVALSAPATATSVKSNAIDVTINVVPGEKPAAEQPKEIFEDDEKFAALLTEGGGQAIPDQRDKYSGTDCLRVTPDQKFNPMLPNLGVKIRENPGPGEYPLHPLRLEKGRRQLDLPAAQSRRRVGPRRRPAAKGPSSAITPAPAASATAASLAIDDKLPAKFEVVTRDLFLDFGEFTLTGLAFSPVDGNAALFDHLYLGRQAEDFELLKVEKQ